MKNEADQIHQLLELSKHLNVSDFEHYIDHYLERKADKGLAIQELDRIIGDLQNHISSFSLYIKQNYLLRQLKRTIPAVRICFALNKK